MGLVELSQSQPHATAVLGAAIGGGRLHHAYLLLGDAQVGRSVAQAVALALVCEARAEGQTDGCGTCSGCRKLAGGNHPDVLGLSPNERGIIPIEPVRELTGRLGLRTVDAAIHVVVVDRADVMNAAAQNALLKTLEEPPGATCFLLTALRQRALLPTVRSRCQLVRLLPAGRDDACQRLMAAGCPQSLAQALAALIGDDSERAALVLQAGAEMVWQTLDDLLAGADAAAVLAAASELASSKEKAELALGLLEVRVRDGLARAFGADSICADSVSGVSRPALAEVASRLSAARRLAGINANRTLLLEHVLAPLCTAGAGK